MAVSPKYKVGRIIIWPPKKIKSIKTRSGTPRITVVYTVAIALREDRLESLAKAPNRPSNNASANDNTATSIVRMAPLRMEGP